MIKSSTTCVDALRLTAKEREDLLRELDEAASRHRGPNHREAERQGYHDAGGILVTLAHPGGSDAHVLARCRNISEAGMGLLHGGFVYPQTPCCCRLKTNRGEAIEIRGVVRRCQHVRGRVHELGVVFDHPIELHQFVTLEDAQVEASNSKAGSGEIEGRVLYVESNVADRELFRYYVSAAGPTVMVATSPAEAAEKVAAEQIDLVVCHDTAGPSACGSFITRLREARYTGAVAVITTDERPSTEQALLAGGVDDVVLSPYRPGDLNNLLRRHLGDGMRSRTLESRLWAEPDAQPLVRKFLELLGDYVDRLNEQIGDGDREAAQRLCLELKGTGGSYGYPAHGS